MFKIYFLLTILATGADGTELRQMHIYNTGSVELCNQEAPDVMRNIMHMKEQGKLFAAAYTDPIINGQCMRTVLSVNGVMQ